MRGRPGFTLIELLVVVAIVVVLAALLSPVLAAVREKSHQAVCASNLQEIGAAYHLYAEEWDETYPFWLPAWDQDAPDGEYEAVTLGPYLSHRGTGVWICPSDPVTRHYLDNHTDAKGRDDWDYRSSYAGNPNFLGHYGGCDPGQGRLMATVKDPAGKILEVEGGVPATWPRAYDGTEVDAVDTWRRKPVEDAEGTLIFSGTWHRGRGNYLFADGHVRLLRLRDTFVPANMWDNVLDWCPGCSCANPHTGPGNYIGYPPEDAVKDAQELDRIGYP